MLNKQGNKNALKYGVIIGGLSMWYMDRWGHQAPNFDNMFGDFNREFAELTGT